MRKFIQMRAIIAAAVLTAGMIMPPASVSAADAGTDTAAAADITESAAIDSADAASGIEAPQPVGSAAYELTGEEKALPVIGTPSDSADVYRIHVKNSTGKNIVSVQIKDIYAGDYPENMLAADDVFADGEERMLYFDASSYEEGTQYTIKVIFEEGRYRTGTAWPFEDMKDAELLLGDVLHAAYTSHELGTEMDTETMEMVYRQAKAEAEAAAAAEAEWDRAHSGGGNGGGGNGGGNGGGGNGGGSPAPPSDDDGCLGDDAVLW